MTKAQLRKIYRQRRELLSAAEKNKLEDLILIQFQKVAIEVPELIMTYASCATLHEYDPALVEGFCLFRNPFTVFAYPSIQKAGMAAFKVNEETIFASNTFGIDEPVNGIPVDNKEIAMIFVPLLAFDKAGYRVGYGKGYYDRFLGTCRPDILKIGFSFFEPEEKIDDADMHDIPLDLCITPARAHTFVN